MKINNWSSIALSANKMAIKGDVLYIPAGEEGIFLSALDDALTPKDFKMNIKKPRNEVGILMSGGLDSVACYLMAKQQGKSVKCFYFDIGQKYKEKELRAIKSMGIEVEIIVLDYSTDIQYDWSHVFPMRNMIFITEIAERLLGGEVYFGVVEGEVKTHLGGDKGEDFLNAIKDILLKYPYPVTLKTPLVNLSKGEIVKWYLDNGYKDYLDKTISCLEEQDGHCGYCQSCFKKYLAFLNNDLKLEINNNLKSEYIVKYQDRAMLGTIGGEYTQKYIDELRDGINKLK